MTKEELMIIRSRIEEAGRQGSEKQYHADGEFGDHGWMDYLKGIRDACWTIDRIIKEEDTKVKEGYVRCKDCKHFRELGETFYYCYCLRIHHTPPNGDWFCADGEKR